MIRLTFGAACDNDIERSDDLLAVGDRHADMVVTCASTKVPLMASRDIQRQRVIAACKHLSDAMTCGNWLCFAVEEGCTQM